MKKAILAITLLFSILMLTACGGGNQEQESTAASSSTPVVETRNNVNNLTGINDLSADAVGKRPVAVMINNITASLPQYGISDADLMFEVLVEGGITRMMAVYGDYTKVPDVCSIRSCRYYYPILAQGFDAVYIHAGYDKTIAYDTLQSLNIDRFDGNSLDPLLFERDADRLQTYAVEHTMKLKGENIPEAMQTAGMRTDLKSGKNQPIFDFNEEGQVIAPNNGKDPCNQVVLQFSDEYYSTFTYDSVNKVYLKQHNGNPHMDSATGEQLAYTNVFVLETNVSVRNEKGLMDVEWHGGTGYYLSGGAYQKIKWSKASEDDGITITDESGNPIKVNTGKSYFGIIQTGSASLTVE